MKQITEQDKKWLKNLSAEEVLRFAAGKFGRELVFASSMGVEDQIITDIIKRAGLDIDVFTLDTGRLFNETYDLIAETEKHYGIKIKMFFPDAKAVEALVNQEGVNLFYKGQAERRRCCHVRKLEPLKRALSPYSAWICGLRHEQSVTRGGLEVVEWDDVKGMTKINPLINWSEKDVWDYVKKHKVPYNKLHDEGFPSIGCACCTRAVKPGEDIRSGRWWWEKPEQKECGLHMVDGKLVRKKIG